MIKIDAYLPKMIMFLINLLLNGGANLSDIAGIAADVLRKYGIRITAMSSVFGWVNGIDWGIKIVCKSLFYVARIAVIF